jgi:hypothetical protein
VLMVLTLEIYKIIYSPSGRPDPCANRAASRVESVSLRVR